MSKNCCDWGCDGSPGCIGGQDRTTAAESCWWPVLDKLPAPKHCETSKQPCTTPYTCNPLCRLITANGGQRVSDGLPVQMFEPPRWYRMPGALTAIFTIVCACIGFGLALYQTF